MATGYTGTDVDPEALARAIGAEPTKSDHLSRAYGIIFRASMNLKVWEARGGHARGAASDVVDGIDKAMRILHDVRAALITEIRKDDDAFMASLDAKYGPVAE